MTTLIKAVGAAGLALALWFLLVQPTINELDIPAAHLDDPGGFIIESLPGLKFPFPTNSNLNLELQQPTTKEPSNLSTYVNIKTAEPVHGSVDVVLAGALASAFISCDSTTASVAKVAHWDQLGPSDKSAAITAEQAQNRRADESSSEMSRLDASTLAAGLRYVRITIPLSRNAGDAANISYDASLECAFASKYLWSIKGASHTVSVPSVFFSRPQIVISPSDQAHDVTQTQEWDPQSEVSVHNSTDLTLASSTASSQTSSDTSSTTWAIDSNQAYGDGDFVTVQANFLSAIFNSQSRIQRDQFHTFLAGVAVAAIVGLAIPVLSGAFDLSAAVVQGWWRRVRTRAHATVQGDDVDRPAPGADIHD